MKSFLSYRVDILTAMKTVKMQWKNLKDPIINNSWKNTEAEGILYVNKIESILIEEQRVKGAMDGVVDHHSTIPISMLFNLPGEQDHVQTVFQDSHL